MTACGHKAIAGGTMIVLGEIACCPSSIHPASELAHDSTDSIDALHTTLTHHLSFICLSSSSTSSLTLAARLSKSSGDPASKLPSRVACRPHALHAQNLMLCSRSDQGLIGYALLRQQTPLRTVISHKAADCISAQQERLQISRIPARTLRQVPMKANRLSRARYHTKAGICSQSHISVHLPVGPHASPLPSRPIASRCASIERFN